MILFLNTCLNKQFCYVWAVYIVLQISETWLYYNKSTFFSLPLYFNQCHNSKYFNVTFLKELHLLLIGSTGKTHIS